MFRSDIGVGRLRLLQNGLRLIHGKPVIGILDFGNEPATGYRGPLFDADRLEDAVQLGTDGDRVVRIEGADRIDKGPELSNLRGHDPNVDGIFLHRLFFLFLTPDAP